MPSEHKGKYCGSFDREGLTETEIEQTGVSLTCNSHVILMLIVPLVIYVLHNVCITLSGMSTFCISDLRAAMTKSYEFNWQKHVPGFLQEGAVFDRFDEVT